MNTTTILSVAISCGPAVGYLITVSVLLLTIKRVPVWLHPVFLAVGLTVRMLTDGWVDASIPAGVAVGVFFLLVLLAGGTVSGVTLFALVVTLALTPIAGWPGIFAGLLVAAVVATVRTWRNLGSERVAWLAMDTIGAVGVSPTGTLKRPDLNLVPDRSSFVDVSDTHSGQASRLRMYLPPYLLLGVGIASLLLDFAR